jgi:hypothetical protein
VPFGLGAVCWAIWQTRNKMAIEKKLVKTPQEVLFKIVIFLQQWMMLLSGEEQEMITHVIKATRKKTMQLNGVSAG